MNFSKKDQLVKLENKCQLNWMRILIDGMRTSDAMQNWRDPFAIFQHNITVFF